MNESEAIKLITSVGHGIEDADALRAIPRTIFHSFAERRFGVFSFLAVIDFDEAFAFMRGLTRCETQQISPFPGSTSLINPAFVVVRQRPIDEWTAIADWIITHCDNPYVPFNFRRTRAQWEAARAPSRSPVEVWRAACELDAAHTRAKNHREEQHGVRTAISHFRAGKNLDSIASPELRERMIEEMERDIQDQ